MMNRIHKQRFFLIVIITVSIAIAAGLALYALQQNINLFYSPTQVVDGVVPHDQEFRLGGVVQTGSVQRTSKDLQVFFVVTDKFKNVHVTYKGILPDLFREGQTVVIEGKLNNQNIVVADQVLAKHDEKYIPREVAAILPKGST